MADLSFCSSSIVSLVPAGSPAAVSRLVISVVVSAFERMSFGWTRAHVGKEQDKIEPSVADGDASPSIVEKARVVVVSTSSQHTSPAIVFGNFVGLPVRSIFEAFFSKAAARARASKLQVSARGRVWFPTIADAIPRHGFGYVVKRRQFPETLTGDIDKLGHPPVYHNHIWVSIG